MHQHMRGPGAGCELSQVDRPTRVVTSPGQSHMAENVRLARRLGERAELVGKRRRDLERQGYCPSERLSML